MTVGATLHDPSSPAVDVAPAPPAPPGVTFASTAPDATMLPLAPDAAGALLLLAIDPVGLGGAVVRGDVGAVAGWTGRLREALPPGVPSVRCSASADEARLLGGLDVAATLAARRSIRELGVLSRAAAGVLTIPGAERLTRRGAALLAMALDGTPLDSSGDAVDAAPAIVAVDDGTDEDTTVPETLADRLAFRLTLSGPSVRVLLDTDGVVPDRRDQVAAAAGAARRTLPSVVSTEPHARAMVEAAEALGVHDARPVLLALRAARASAAWDGRQLVTEEDLTLAVMLVLAPRATRIPAGPPDTTPAEPPAHDAEPPVPEPPAGEQPAPRDSAVERVDPPRRANRSDADASNTEPQQPPEAESPEEPIAERLVEAARAALPPRLLAELARRASAAAAGAGAGGRSGATMTIGTRGRPLPSRAGDPRRARLDVLATVRAAAPWQTLRARLTNGVTGGAASGLAMEGINGPAAPAPDAGSRRLHIRRADFRVRRHERTRVASVIFAVDASGSAALARLAEAKGAIEMMLADSYARRDRVSLVAFRGDAAELLLPPTRAPARARRLLAGLAGGGGTPLASGLDCARVLAERERRGGADPLIVVLTDGRANIARDGTQGRPLARTDALAAARAIGAASIPTVIVDVAIRPEPFARMVADAAGARYLWLPGGDAGSIGAAVRGAGTGA